MQLFFNIGCIIDIVKKFFKVDSIQCSDLIFKDVIFVVQVLFVCMVVVRGEDELFREVDYNVIIFFKIQICFCFVFKCLVVEQWFNKFVFDYVFGEFENCWFWFMVFFGEMVGVLVVQFIGEFVIQMMLNIFYFVGVFFKNVIFGVLCFKEIFNVVKDIKILFMVVYFDKERVM